MTPDSAAAGDLVVYRPGKKLMLGLLVGAVFIAIGIEMVTHPGTTFDVQSKGVVVAIGWVGLIFFGLGEISLLVRALRPSPVLRIDDTGVTNRTNLASIPFLPWSEILGTTTTTVAGANVLVIEVADPQKLLASCKSPVRRALTQRSLTEGYGISNIPEPAVPGSLGSLQDRIEWLAKRPR